MILFAVLLIAVTAAQQQITPDIVYKYSDAYQLIWKDAGSGSEMDGAVWKAQNYQSEYCSLGDVATEGWSEPKSKAVLVSQRKAGALVSPSSFTLVWNDGGSGADADVAIYKMNAPSGYTCLGGVAVNSHSTKPDSNKYCCVKNEYVVQAEAVHTWNDRGSGSNSDLSLWTIIRAGGDSQGLDAGNFVGVSGYSKPSSSAAYLLKADESKVRDLWSLPTGEDKQLNLYEVSELKKIWNDAGSGADADCSIWRAEPKEGYYPLGDIVVATHTKPKIGFMLRPTDANDDSVRQPISYSKIWNDAGSGADNDVQLWRVTCPSGYVSLGSVATSGSYPAVGDVYCVNSRYTTYGSSSNWGYVWRDHGSGANSDVSIWEARATSVIVQSVRGFGAVSNYNYYPTSPYFLKKEFLTYWAEKPISKIKMYNVNYELDAERQQTTPETMSPTIIMNNSQERQTISRTLSYSIAKEESFTFTQAIQLGIAVEITAGSPLIGIEQKTTISLQATSTFSTGETTTETKEESVTANVEVPARSQITAWIQGTKYKADIPYTATIKKFFFDGTTALATISGVYKGVAISEIKVMYGEIEYFD